MNPPALDNHASEVIEELLRSLKSSCTLLVVTHAVQQVQRIADRILLLDGKGHHTIEEMPSIPA